MKLIENKTDTKLILYFRVGNKMSREGKGYKNRGSNKGLDELKHLLLRDIARISLSCSLGLFGCF